jgi:hypothetical protein
MTPYPRKTTKSYKMVLTASVRFSFALFIWLLCSEVVLAASPVIMMDSREAPTAAERPRMKAFSRAEIAATLLIVLPDLPAPSGAELLQRDAKAASDPTSLSYGRVPMQLGVNGPGASMYPPGLMRFE